MTPDRPHDSDGHPPTGEAEEPATPGGVAPFDSPEDSSFADPQDSDDSVDSPPEPLGRAWVGPALLLAGGLSLARSEVLLALGMSSGLHSEETARWIALAQWPALMVQALLMSAAAVAVVWSARGLRLLPALIIAALILTSAVTGWPVAPEVETLRGPLDGLPNILEIYLVGLALGLAVALCAWICRRTPALESAAGSLLIQLLVAAPTLGGPAYLLWQGSLHVPLMPVREVLAQLHEEQHWSVVLENPKAPVRRGVWSPLLQLGVEGREPDTGDRVGLVMAPPCEVAVEIPADAEGARLNLGAQIAGRHTELGSIDEPSLINGISVRFEVLVDGASVLDETLTHRFRDQPEARGWKDRELAVSPGQRLTLRTTFADPDTERAYRDRELVCGYAGLALERLGERPRTLAIPEEPNLLLIAVDGLRADRLSSYGYEKPTTPNMDALAREGLLFESTYATSSWSWPSSASLITGRLPHEHGVLSTEAASLHLDEETLAEALQAHGFTTAAISANPLISPVHQFDQGFESFDGATRWRRGAELIETIEARLQELSRTRFFLYVHLSDPLAALEPLESEQKRLGGKRPEALEEAELAGDLADPVVTYGKRLARGEATDELGVIRPALVVPEEDAQWISDRYDAGVGTADVYVGRILKRLGELGLVDRTVIALTGTHGVELLDHGLYGTGHSVHREAVQVPLLLAGPYIRPGIRVKATLSNRHLGPTLAWVAGTSLDSAEEGLDLLIPDLPDQSVQYQVSGGFWNGRWPTEILGLREGGHVVHYAPHGLPWKGEGTPASRWRIYELESDPFEGNDLSLDPGLAELADPLVEKLERQLEARGSRDRQGWGAGPAALRALRELGYLGLEEVETPAAAPAGD